MCARWQAASIGGRLRLIRRCRGISQRPKPLESAHNSAFPPVECSAFFMACSKLFLAAVLQK